MAIEKALKTDGRVSWTKLFGILGAVFAAASYLLSGVDLMDPQTWTVVVGILSGGGVIVGARDALPGKGPQ